MSDRTEIPKSRDPELPRRWKSLIARNAAHTRFSQVPGGPDEKEIVRGERGGHGAEGQQGVGPGVLHVRPVLGAVLPPEHLLRRLPRVPGAGARGRHVPVARIRVLHHQPSYLYRLQQNVQGRVHSAIEMQMFQVSESSAASRVSVRTVGEAWNVAGSTAPETFLQLACSRCDSLETRGVVAVVVVVAGQLGRRGIAR